MMIMANWYIKLDPVGEDGQIEYFKEWVKNHPKAPLPLQRVLENIGIKVGESYPLWTNDFAEAMFFDCRDMANHTAEKIEEMIPDFKGAMHVREALSYVPSEDDDIADGIGQTFSPD